jgi:DNA invertase Pin-like site-specific DNA recombinase
MIQLYAVIAEWERDQLSARTKAILAAAKARSVALGNAGRSNLGQVRTAQKETAAAGRLSGVLARFKARGLTQRGMVDDLNSIDVRTARGGAWSLMQMQRVLTRQ